MNNFFIKRSYILLIVFFVILFIFGVDKNDSAYAQSQQENCSPNAEGGSKTCFPVDGNKQDWQLYTYHHSPSYSNQPLRYSHCAIDFYPIQDTTPGGIGTGGKGDDASGVNYNPNAYALWDGEVLNAEATGSSCGVWVRIKTTQAQAGQKIYRTSGEHLTNAYFIVEYCHIQSNSLAVSIGDIVSAGEYVGRAGSSGGEDPKSSTVPGTFKKEYWKNITGSHLHLRVRVVADVFSNDKSLSIPERELAGIAIFNGIRAVALSGYDAKDKPVKDPRGWEYVSNINKTKLCNKYTIDPDNSTPPPPDITDPAGGSDNDEALYCSSFDDIAVSGNASVILQSSGEGGYYLDTYPTHGAAVANATATIKDKACVGALDIYRTNKSGAKIRSLDEALEVYSPFDGGSVIGVGDLDGPSSIEKPCGNGVSVRYRSLDLDMTLCHLSLESSIPVVVGQKVDKGGVIGYLKEPVGNANNTHIHINMYELDGGTRVNMLTEKEIAVVLGIDPNSIVFVGDDNVGTYRDQQERCFVQNDDVCSDTNYISRLRVHNNSNIFPANNPREEELIIEKTNTEVQKIEGSVLKLSWPSLGGVKIEDADLGLEGTLVYFFTLILWIAVILAFLSLLHIGFLYIFSQDNPEKVKEAKERLVKVVTGLAILLSSYLIFNLLGINTEESIQKFESNTEDIVLPNYKISTLEEYSFEGWYRYIPIGEAVRSMWVTYNAMVGECEDGVDAEKCGGLSPSQGGLIVNEPQIRKQEGIPEIIRGISQCISDREPTAEEQGLVNRINAQIESINSYYGDFVDDIGSVVKINELARMDSKKCEESLGVSTLYTCTGSQEESFNPTNKKDCDNLYVLGEEPDKRIDDYERFSSLNNDEDFSNAKLDYFCDGVAFSMTKMSSLSVGEFINGPIAYYKPAGYGIIDRKWVNEDQRIPFGGDLALFLRNLSSLRSNVYSLGYGCSDDVDIDKLASYSNAFSNARQNIYSAVREIIHEEAPIRAEIFSLLDNDELAGYLRGNCTELENGEGIILQTRIRDGEYSSDYEEKCKTDARIIKSILETRLEETLQNATPDRRSSSMTCGEVKQKIAKYEEEIGPVGESCDRYDSCCPNETLKRFSEQCEPLDIFKCRANGYDWK